MKKLLFIALAVIAFGTIVWAADVGLIPSKNTGESVSYTEFNTLVKTIKGIFNRNFAGKNKIGINMLPTSSASLSVKGLLRVKPITTASRPNCKNIIKGSIYADSTKKHLWGCNGNDWVQLDTQDPVCN